ncbi:cytochrome P450 [Streptomyces caniscabiei]|uniref:cytochrome P450 n=1 Tax=Streptomyces caniscabiei TaxID=2746961 RepID=UPI0029A4F08D|nr:cytochrome P450 [Streptomyces caniscabiei]MDX2600826.1 cytochrome P450 [Streptomyces caniscabiei]MDX2736593.1 cytochrome P450 [Streptomyces caniscabiei]MDX2783414.1 cytochrome P450 [Streptomyces caniscabiei]
MAEPVGFAYPPCYRELQENEPLARVRMAYGMEARLITRHADVRAVLADPRFSRAATAGVDIPRSSPVMLHDASIVTMDPPEHTRLRRMVAQAFTKRGVEAMRPRVVESVARLLDAMEEQGPPADLVTALAQPLPILAICALFGVVDDRSDTFRELAHTMFTGTEQTAVESAFGEIMAMITTLVAERRRTASEDLLGRLVSACDDDDRLSEEELVGLALALLVGGFENSAQEIANCAALVLRSPDHLAELRARPDLVPSAVEEVLRFAPLSVTGGLVRIAVDDVELGSGTIRKGEAVIIDTQSANLDPAVFDDPTEMDIHRSPNPHLIFGHGAHRCIGAELARMELQVTLGSLLQRFPTLALAVPAEDIPFTGGMLRGPACLPVTW